DLEFCPFIAVVCVGTHNHPPSPLEKIPINIKLSLQSLISKVIEENDVITLQSIQSSNLIKAYFKSKMLSEIHQLLNSIDKLRILVTKAYKNMHPYGQAELLINLKSFQIDLAFKRIKGDINEFEINTYDAKNKLTDRYKKLFCTLFKTIQELINENIYIHHIHQKGWECIIGDLDSAQAKAKSILNAPSQELVESILDKIESSDKPGAKDAIEIMEMESTNNAEGTSMVQNNNKTDLILDIELKERKIALLECQTRVRKEAAKAKAIELQN
ncbi:17074_t:CDS:2, partial [Cetraspora pellucida]